MGAEATNKAAKRTFARQQRAVCVLGGLGEVGGAADPEVLLDVGKGMDSAAG